MASLAACSGAVMVHFLCRESSGAGMASIAVQCPSDCCRNMIAWFELRAAQVTAIGMAIVTAIYGYGSVIYYRSNKRGIAGLMTGVTSIARRRDMVCWFHLRATGTWNMTGTASGCCHACMVIYGAQKGSETVMTRVACASCCNVGAWFAQSAA